MSGIRATIFSIFLAAAACGGGTTSTQNAVNGSIYDPATATSRTFTARDAVVNTQTAKGFAINGPAAFVEIADFAGICADEANASTTAAYYPATGQTLTLGLAVRARRSA